MDNFCEKNDVSGAILKWTWSFRGTALHVLFSELLKWARPPTYEEVSKKENTLFEKNDKSQLLFSDHFA